MKGVMVVVSTLLGLIAGILAFVLLEQSSIRSDLRTELGEARNRIENLEAENKQITSKLQEQRSKLQEERQENQPTQQAKSNASNSSHSSTRSESSERTGSQPESALQMVTSSEPRSYQVRTYLDGDYLGKAWMVLQDTSRTTKTDANKTGKTTYEPVVVLPDKLRKHVVVRKTNVVKRVRRPSRQRPVYNNYNYRYYNSYAAAAAASFANVNQGNDVPSNGANNGSNQEARPTQGQRRPRSSSPWAAWPQTGKNIRQQQQEAAQGGLRNRSTRSQPLGIRASQIETKQVPRFND